MYVRKLKNYNKCALFTNCEKIQQTLAGMPPLTTWQLWYKTTDPKESTKGSFVFEAPNYVGESNCECIRRTLPYIQMKLFSRVPTLIQY